MEIKFWVDESVVDLLSSVWSWMALAAIPYSAIGLLVGRKVFRRRIEPEGREGAVVEAVASAFFWVPVVVIWIIVQIFARMFAVVEFFITVGQENPK